MFLQAVGAAATSVGFVGAGMAETASSEPEENRDDSPTVSLTHGVATGDVTANTAVVWARAKGDATVHVEYSPDESFDSTRRDRTGVDGETDFTGKIHLDGLQSGTRYRYRVWATAIGTGDKGGDAADEEAPGSAVTGTFVTPPGPSEEGAVTFAWSGDTWGYGDDPVEPPYPGFETIADRQPDFFLYHGDTIYADAKTPAEKITEDTPIGDALEIYRDKYNEMRDPPSEVAQRTNLKGLLESTSVYSVWDDHEAVNNFAGPIEPLMLEGRRAFREYWPIDRDGSSQSGESSRLYDSFRWGKHVELFLIDTRQYRDPNVELDSKTLLGREQFEWLKGALSDSDATWKILASPAPLGYPSDSLGDPGRSDRLRIRAPRTRRRYRDRTHLESRRRGRRRPQIGGRGVRSR